MRYGTTLGLPLLLAIAVCGCSDATGDASAATCNNVVGEYKWFIGGKVAFSSRGTVRWMPAVASIPPATGTWTCSDFGTYKVTWENGFVDTLNLSADGSTLSGLSSTGIAVTGTRGPQGFKTTTAANAPKPPSGTTQTATGKTTSDGWTPIGNPDSGFGKQSTVPIGPNGPQPIDPRSGRPPPKGAG